MSHDSITAWRLLAAPPSRPARHEETTRQNRFRIVANAVTLQHGANR
ncbi:hypothetical protein OH491_03685 [Termitidicoccus mucosus]